jgi:hypothetical protein
MESSIVGAKEQVVREAAVFCHTRRTSERNEQGRRCFGSCRCIENYRCVPLYFIESSSVGGTMEKDWRVVGIISLRRRREALYWVRAMLSRQRFSLHHIGLNFSLVCLFRMYSALVNGHPVHVYLYPGRDTATWDGQGTKRKRKFGRYNISCYHLFLPDVFTFMAWEMAMTTSHQRSIVKIQKSAEVLIYI